MAEQHISFKVRRYKEGQVDQSFQTFSSPVDEDTTVLVALQDIRREQDPSLTLRHSCHHASCGTCGMKVNGQEQLACVTTVLELKTSEVIVEPLDNLPLISDLVVDMDGFIERYSTPELPYMRSSEFLPEADLPEGIAQWLRFENCLECGICVSACPIAGTDPFYLGPAALAAAWRAVDEPRGGDRKMILDWVDNQHGCWRCHAAFECSELCPSDVDPAGAIMSLRSELTRRRLKRVFGGK